MPTPAITKRLKGLDLAEIAITSGAALFPGEGPADAFRMADVPGVSVLSDSADGNKCQRCWQVLEEVGKQHKHDDLCKRCDAAVDALPATVA